MAALSQFWRNFSGLLIKVTWPRELSSLANQGLNLGLFIKGARNLGEGLVERKFKPNKQLTQQQIRIPNYDDLADLN